MNEATQKSRISFMKNYSTFSVSLSLALTDRALSTYKFALSWNKVESETRWEKTALRRNFFQSFPGNLTMQSLFVCDASAEKKNSKIFFWLLKVNKKFIFVPRAAIFCIIKKWKEEKFVKIAMWKIRNWGILGKLRRILWKMWRKLR